MTLQRKKLNARFLGPDPCSSNPCHQLADCIELDGQAMCTCQSGYTGDGFACESKIIIEIFFH